MIDCEFVQDNLSAYIDDELPAEDKRKIHLHLQTCLNCNREYTELKITAAIMRSLSEIEPPPGVKERVKERLLDETVNNPISKIKKGKWYTLGAVAAGLLLLVGSWGLLYDGGLAKILGDSAGTQEIAFEETGSQEKAALQADQVAQPFGAFIQERDEEASQAPLAVSEEPLPMDMGELYAENDTDQKYYREVASIEDGEPEGDRLERPPSEGKETNNESSTPQKGQSEDISIAAVEPEKNSSGGSNGNNEDPLSRMTLMSTEPSEESLQLELRVKTQDLSQTHKAIERIAQVYELQVSTRETNEMIAIEVYVPISQQGAVKEELEALGHVTSEEISNPDLNKKISQLIDSRTELEQQQIELRAMINNGGSLENVKAWQSELAKVTEETDKITAQIHQLETVHGPTCIKLILVK